jgi:hypothetical protein
MSEMRLGIKKSEQHKLTISLAQLNCKKIEVTDLEKGISTTYNSMGEAARVLNIPCKSISYNLNSIKKKAL